MATVNTTLVTRLENLSRIETPDQLKEVAEAISDFQILKSNFTHAKLSAIKRSLLNLSLDFAEQKLRNAQKELNELQIDIYHV